MICSNCSVWVSCFFAWLDRPSNRSWNTWAMSLVPPIRRPCFGAHSVRIYQTRVDRKFCCPMVSHWIWELNAETSFLWRDACTARCIEEQIQKRVQQAQPILESFGNAVTMRTSLLPTCAIGRAIWPGCSGVDRNFSLQVFLKAPRAYQSPVYIALLLPWPWEIVFSFRSGDPRFHQLRQSSQVDVL